MMWLFYDASTSELLAKITNKWAATEFLKELGTREGPFYVEAVDLGKNVIAWACMYVGDPHSLN